MTRRRGRPEGRSLGSPRGRRWWAGRPRGDRGVTAIELALLTPFVLLMIMLTIQFAFLWHGRHVALAAAKEGARVARTTDGGNWDVLAENRARAYVAQVGPRLLETVDYDPVDAGFRRGMVVTGSAVRVMPFVPDRFFTVQARSVGPVECFRADDGDLQCD